MLDDRTTEHVTDVVLPSSLGPITFERYYSPSPYSFALRDVFGRAGPEGAYNGFPFTFGASPLYGATAHWVDNWQSLIRVKEMSVTVLDPAGRVVDFGVCSSFPCNLAAADPEHGRAERLTLTSDGGTLFTESGRYIYQHSGDGFLRLSRWDDVQYASGSESTRLRALVSYGRGCRDAGDSDYVASIANAEGAALVFNWATVENQCALGSIDIAKGGVSERAVTFGYAEGPGLITEARYGSDGGGRVLNYVPSTTSWAKSENGVQVVAHSFSGTTTVTGQGNVAMYSKISASDGGLNSSWNHEVPILGSNSRTPLTLSFQMTNTGSNVPRLTQITQSCEGTECYSTWSRNFTYSAGSDLFPGQLTSESNVRGGYTVYSRGMSGQTMPSGWPSPVELTAVAAGATNSSGSNALETTSYAYSYGSENQSPRGYEQFLAEERQTSVLDGGVEAITTIVRDHETNRVKAVFRSGLTRVFSDGGWATAARTIGTFYFTNRKCGDEAADPLGRTLEVHGPCIVANTSATDCASGSVLPVTQYEYFAPDAGSVNGGRLASQKRWVDATDPDSCTGTSLTTTFSNYDVFGNPGSVTDANGVTTSVVYKDGLPLSTTVNGKTTIYTWDQGSLASIRHPDGNYDVFCHRAVSLGSACSPSNTWSPQLRWHAKAANQDGTSYTEATASFYQTDGRLAREEVWDGVRNLKRRERKYDLNSSGRPLRTTIGVGDGAYYALKRYDADGVLTGTNDAASSAVCNQQASAGASGATYCANLKNDRIGRLESMDLEGATTNETGRTCITYDAQGNVASTRQGCESNAVSFPGPSCGDCTQSAAQYQYDDFGNLVSASLPHLGSAGSGTVNMAYDARGALLIRQTPNMAIAGAWHAYSYDGLGRELALVHSWTSPSSGSETLYSAVYDEAASLDGSCPQPTNTRGRLLKRTDTFGQTWYQYSPEGWLTGEIRLRTGSSCSSRLPRDVPHTLYTYSDNGVLTSIQYPYGRTVTYTLGTYGGVTTDRPVSIGVTMWDGSDWDSWTAIENIAFEPFGDVRAYQFNTSSPSSVEYLPGDYSYASENSCPMARPTTNDYSGRRRLVQVTGSSLPTDGGTGGGDIFQLFTSYDALKPTRIATCWGSAAMKQYDPIYFHNQVTRTYTAPYDVRGNRKTMPPVGIYTADTYQYSDAGAVDRLVSVTRPDSPTVYFDYDDDGRTSNIRLPADSTGLPADEEVWSAASSGSATHGGLDSVYKSVSVSGAVYGYYYDAANRRRLKEYPTSETDEFFYDSSNRLLVDRGNATVSSPGYFTTDEYVWLGQRPVLVVRGRLSTSDDSRSSDTTSTCGRNGNSEACGAYFIITDDLPKPVAVLDDAGKHARRMNWDAFGAVNQRELRNSETPHPYANSQTYGLFYETLPVLSGMTLKYRFRLDAVDTEGSASSPVDTLTVLHNWVTQSTIGGAHRGRVFTPWVSQSPAATFLLFTSSSRSCPPEGCLADGGYPDGGSFPYYGVSSTMVELVEKQSGAKEFDLPLRFPGQYYDAETQKHENWNRYYDPSTARYLSPEPLTQSPNYIAAMAGGGMSVPTYAYAANNPLRYVDRNGLWYSVGTWDPEDVDLQNYIWGEIGRAAMDPIIGPKVLEMWASPKEFKIWGRRKFGDSETSSKTCAVDFSFSKYNLDDASSPYPGRTPDGYRGYNRSTLWHEMGHQWAIAHGLSDTEILREGVMWENRGRMGLPDGRPPFAPSQLRRIHWETEYRGTIVFP